MKPLICALVDSLRAVLQLFSPPDGGVGGVGWVEVGGVDGVGGVEVRTDDFGIKAAPADIHWKQPVQREADLTQTQTDAPPDRSTC